MMEFILSLDEFSAPVLTIMLLAALTATYRLNLRLVRYATVGKLWIVTDKINSLGKYLVMLAMVGVLPIIVAITLPIKLEIGSGFFLYAGFAGYVAMIMAMPVLMLALVWRVFLSDVSMITFASIVFKALKNKLQAHWRVIVLSVSAITLLVFLWPIVQLLIYIGAFVLLARIGALDDSSYSGSDLFDLHNVTDTGYSWDHGELLMEKHRKKLL